MSGVDSSVIRNDRNLKPAFYNDKCDKYDYLIAVGCGAIAGLVDIFLVGAPTDSKLQGWTDGQVDKTVMAFAKTCGWSPREGKEKSIASAIGFLEKKFPVNYDQRHSGDVGELFSMSAKNHHMKSLAHSPDIIGLFFSLLNQFTSTSSFLHNGQLITIQTETYELQGHDFVSKLFCGVANWFGHIMSDVAGSSGASGRGSGVVIPFYELFQLCDFGEFKVAQRDKVGNIKLDRNGNMAYYKNNLTQLATRTFEEGYDARFGLTMAIPVVLCDLSIKLIWAIKHYFYHKRPLHECIPTKRHDDLRIMLIIGDGTLCLMDGTDAFVRSGGDALAFVLRLNLVAWYRLVMLVFREVCIRLGISFPLQKQLDAYIRINEALTLYLTQLEKIDFEQFKKETAVFNEFVGKLSLAKSDEQLNQILVQEMKKMGITMPWEKTHGSFDGFMRDNSAVLRFS